MAYVKQTWENLPSTNTPITAERLNHMEDGIYEASEQGGSTGSVNTGIILPFAGLDSTIPNGYLLCDGSAVSRTTYSDLFSVIGTTYGTGDGSSTFNLPNLKGKVLVGVDVNDTDFDTLGETGGEKTHTLITNEIPSHSHTTAYAYLTGAEATNGGGSGWTKFTGTATNNSTNTTGGGQAHNNLQPYMAMNYIIKY